MNNFVYIKKILPYQNNFLTISMSMNNNSCCYEGKNFNNYLNMSNNNNFNNIIYCVKRNRNNNNYNYESNKFNIKDKRSKSTKDIIKQYKINYGKRNYSEIFNLSTNENTSYLTSRKNKNNIEINKNNFSLIKKIEFNNYTIKKNVVLKKYIINNTNIIKNIFNDNNKYYYINNNNINNNYNNQSLLSNKNKIKFNLRKKLKEDKIKNQIKKNKKNKLNY